jgi:hypothetical protein
MAVTVQMQFESAVTEMYQNAFVGSSIADIEQPTREKFDIVDRPHPQTSEGF